MFRLAQAVTPSRQSESIQSSQKSILKSLALLGASGHGKLVADAQRLTPFCRYLHVTGWAQVNGRNAISWERGHRPGCRGAG
jgi:hypothetical protein